jgi:hypothetical protein
MVHPLGLSEEGRRRCRGGIVKLTGKGQNRSHWECVLAVDGPPLSHLQRRADSKMPFASHSGPLFLGDHR